MTTPSPTIHEAETDAEAPHLAIADSKRGVGAQANLPEARRQVAKVLLAVHQREPARAALEGIRAAVWEPNTRVRTSDGGLHNAMPTNKVEPVCGFGSDIREGRLFMVPLPTPSNTNSLSITSFVFRYSSTRAHKVI
jgi:hypothetical protein